MRELERIGLHGLHAQDLQNCLCEFDKWMRVRLGEGKPKRRSTRAEFEAHKVRSPEAPARSRGRLSFHPK